MWTATKKKHGKQTKSRDNNIRWSTVQRVRYSAVRNRQLWLKKFNQSVRQSHLMCCENVQVLLLSHLLMFWGGEIGHSSGASQRWLTWLLSSDDRRSQRRDAGFIITSTIKCYIPYYPGETGATDTL